MTLSIVMPVLNEAGGIVAALEALQPYRARGVQIVVADGGSSDATRDLARPLADHVIIAPRGRARQMNAGASVAQGDVLLFLHADTSLPDNADLLIERGLHAYQRAWGRFDVRFDRGLALRVIAAAMNRRSWLTGIATGDQAMFVTRTAFQQAGRFPPIALMEDIALSAALKQLTHPLCLTARVTTSGIRWRRHGIIRTVLVMWSLRLRYYFGADPDALARAYGYR